MNRSYYRHMSIFAILLCMLHSGLNGMFGGVSQVKSKLENIQKKISTDKTYLANQELPWLDGLRKDIQYTPGMKEKFGALFEAVKGEITKKEGGLAPMVKQQEKKISARKIVAPAPPSMSKEMATQMFNVVKENLPWEVSEDVWSRAQNAINEYPDLAKSMLSPELIDSLRQPLINVLNGFMNGFKESGAYHKAMRDYYKRSYNYCKSVLEKDAAIFKYRPTFKKEHEDLAAYFKKEYEYHKEKRAHARKMARTIREKMRDLNK